MTYLTNVDIQSAKTSDLSVFSESSISHPPNRDIFSRALGVTIMALFWGGVAFAVAAAIAIVPAIGWAIFSILT